MTRLVWVTNGNLYSDFRAMVVFAGDEYMAKDQEEKWRKLLAEWVRRGEAVEAESGWEAYYDARTEILAELGIGEIAPLLAGYASPKDIVVSSESMPFLVNPRGED